VTRRRALAGQRTRARLGGDPPPAVRADPADRSRRTAVLDRPVAASPDPVGSRHRRPDLVLVAAVLVVAVLLVTAVLLTVRARSADRAEQARTAATAAAEAAAVDLLSYDYRHLDRDFARARSHLTGRFVADYTTTTQHTVRPLAPQVHAVVKATVASSSVVRASENKVVVLLFVNQTTTSTRLDAPRTDLNRVRLTMTRVGGGWKVSKVAAL
jgi:Mce-associated membrane protein